MNKKLVESEFKVTTRRNRVAEAARRFVKSKKVRPKRGDVE